VQRCLAQGGTNVALADANYVSVEGEIYAQRHHLLKKDSSRC